MNNQSQKQAIEYNDGPLLIVAGAGTGKTTVITQKISHLIESGKAKPEEILALTFTDKASQEMEERVDGLLALGYVDLQISTFHAFCQKLLEEYGLEIGIPHRFKLLSTTDLWLLLREHIYDFNLEYYRPLGNPTSQIHALIEHFSTCRDELVEPQDYINYVEGLKLDTDDAQKQEKSRLAEIANAYHVYNQLLLDTDSMDFGGLIAYSVKLLRNRPNILQKLQQRFKYILVDEFQDVNWAQYELVRLLTGSQTRLTVVGDDDQSIYSFRGSNVSIIMRFKDDFKDAKEIVLTENYRSGQEILDVAYKSIINNNPDRLEVKLHINKALKSQTKIQSKVEHIHCATLDDEVHMVISKILEIKKEHEDVTFDDFAILARANSHVEPFLNALESYNIPYEYIASSGLYRQPVVLDAVSFLGLLEHIHDDRSIYRLLRIPFFDFSENDLQKFTAGAKKKSISYYEALKRASEFQISPSGIAIAEKLISLIHTGMKNARFEKPTSVLYQFMEDSGYFRYLTHEESQANREVIRQIYHLKQFFDLVSEYEQAVPGSHVAGFMEHYTYIISSGDGGKMRQLEETPDSVNILTVHGSKGLEYKYVFVINCVEERFPTRRKSEGISLPEELIVQSLCDATHPLTPSLTEERGKRAQFSPLLRKRGAGGELRVADFHYQEERRLFYVAITRAKEQLFLMSADDYEGVRKKKVSRFVVEIEDILKKTEHTEKEKLLNTLLVKPNKLMEEDRAIFQYVPPKKFSFSQINSYERCPYQYKLAHILKIPMKGSASFSFGNTIHNTLQKFYERIQELNSVRQDSLFGLPVQQSVQSNNIKIPKFEELLELYEKSWVADWYQNKKQREMYFEKGKEILKIFYTSQEDNWTIPVSLEGWFKIKVGEYFINGRIDRIDKLSDGTLEIIDYKTGNAKETLTSDDKQQLLIYQIAAQTLSEYKNIGDVSKLTFYYVNDNLKTSFIGTDKDTQKLQEKLLRSIEGIHSGNFDPTPNKFVCQYCDYKEICEFRKL